MRMRSPVFEVFAPFTICCMCQVSMSRHLTCPITAAPDPVYVAPPAHDVQYVAAAGSTRCAVGGVGACACVGQARSGRRSRRPWIHALDRLQRQRRRDPKPTHAARGRYQCAICAGSAGSRSAAACDCSWRVCLSCGSTAPRAVARAVALKRLCTAVHGSSIIAPFQSTRVLNWRFARAASSETRPAYPAAAGGTGPQSRRTRPSQRPELPRFDLHRAWTPERRGADAPEDRRRARHLTG